MAKALFLSEDWLKKTTSINEYVDVSMVTPFIVVTQDTKLQEELGNALYELLQDAVAGGTVSPVQSELLTVIRPALAWWSFSNTIPHVAVRVRNAGLTKNTSANHENATQQEQARLIAMGNSYAGYFAKELRKWLCAHRADFPMWVPNKDSTYNVGIHFWNPVPVGCGCPCD